ncbi:MAG: sensor histidine kinase [Candidatus Merdivicinus sp.]
MKKSSDVEKELQLRLKLLDTAKAAALQAHINPHFLCNTLEVINFMALRELGEENDVSSTVISLSKVLRQSLETETMFISLQAEIENSIEYIKIQKIRYKDRFKVEWQIDADTRDCKVINIMLQPLLENAIYYGIKPLVDRCGLINVRSYFQEDQLIIEVSDNGAGMDRAAIDKLNNDMQQEYIQKNRHIGLMNVNQRIKLLFGEEYGLVLKQNIENTGITCSIILPNVDIS